MILIEYNCREFSHSPPQLRQRCPNASSTGPHPLRPHCKSPHRRRGWHRVARRSGTPAIGHACSRCTACSRRTRGSAAATCPGRGTARAAVAARGARAGGSADRGGRGASGAVEPRGPPRAVEACLPSARTRWRRRRPAHSKVKLPSSSRCGHPPLPRPTRLLRAVIWAREAHPRWRRGFAMACAPDPGSPISLPLIIQARPLS